MNRLSNEQSPYLLQHADNPVDWYPWGKEAFEKAKELDRPIFLSIGYSTCHWCHVMEHESFEDDSVAKLLNDSFISIKVDREELPEIDHVYMSVCQAMTGGGGWPLTIVMTPEKEPFFAGTYFPKDKRGGRSGLFQILPMITDAWTSKRQDIMTSVGQVKNYLNRLNSKPAGNNFSTELITRAYDQFRNGFDEEYGGFFRAPKFPSPHNLIFLMRYYHSFDNKIALDMATKTLKQMRLGGIYDHIGFGFHRYSTDRHWFVPHFEKMLYDQAMIAMAYTEAYHITGDEIFAQTAREIFTYVLRDMTASEGGFYSAEDADSEGEEGKFYIWTEQEITEVLGKDYSKEFNDVFSITTSGNYRDESSGKETRLNIPHLKNYNANGNNELESAREKLFNVREKRIHPLKDDKILTDWNGLMIAALAKAAIVLDEPVYLDAAEKAAEFALHSISDGERLLKRYRNGVAALDAHLDDYAFMAWGLLELYEATFAIKYLSQALDLMNIMVEDFWDDKNGGFFLGSDQSEKLIVRSKTAYDGAIPSGNSVAVMNMVKLTRMTGNTNWAELAEKTIRAFSEDVNRVPTGYTLMLTAFMFDTQNSKEIVIVGDSRDRNTKRFLHTIRAGYAPHKVLLFKDTAGNDNKLEQLASWTSTQNSINGKPTAYVCKNFACNQPTSDLQTALSFINE
ncbi:MAG: thioredoxin domain-containing protein [Candidatus Neomarinimicrobiota bacterium]|nr:MAG: thioredoxin domain-containing protein [Candidatus Neomarinimicrobiota bacterium]